MSIATNVWYKFTFLTGATTKSNGQSMPSDLAVQPISAKLDGHNLIGLNTDKASGNEYWRFTLDSNGYYKITRKADSKVIDGKASTTDIYLNDSNNGDYQRWQLLDRGNGQWAIRHKATGRLMTRDANNKVYLAYDNGSPLQSWALVQVLNTMQQVEESTDYLEPALPPKTQRVELTTNQVYENPSNASIQQTIIQNTTKTSIFSWSLTETLTASASATWKANVPFGAAEGTVTVELSLQAGQTSTKQESETYGVNTTIIIPANSSVSVSTWLDWCDDYTTQFNTNFWISGYALTTDNSKVSLTGVDIVRNLPGLGFTGSILEVEDHAALVCISGTYTGSQGLRSGVTTTALEPVSA